MNILSKNCIECKTIFYKKYGLGMKQWLNAKFCAQKCHYLWNSKHLRREFATVWKDHQDYGSIHKWIYYNYGKANRCDNREDNILIFDCSGISTKFQWAKIHGKDYARDRNNFYMLCASCHTKYDVVNRGKRKEKIMLDWAIKNSKFIRKRSLLRAA